MNSDYKLSNSNYKSSLINFIGVPIKNELGEHNCFLNVLIHLIYNINEIKKFLLEEESKRDEKYGLINSLKDILQNYQNLQKECILDKILDPYILRKEIAELFKDEKKFCLRKMEDPVEALIVIINSFHSQYLGEKSLKNVVERTCNENCLSHKYFWINILQQDVCKCGASSEVLQYDYNYFIYEVYVKEILISCDKENLKKINYQLMRYLKKINAQTNTLCPEKCSLNKVTRKLYLLNNPKYFIFNLSWDESNPLLQDICKLYFCLPTFYRVDDLYDIPETNQLVEYEIFGLLCYWGAHYVCYIKQELDKNEFWENYDDTTIIRIKDWTELIKKAIKSHLHPVVIIYRTKSDNTKKLKEQNFSSNDQDEILKFCKKTDEQNKITKKGIRSSSVNPNTKLSKINEDDKYSNKKEGLVDNEMNKVYQNGSFIKYSQPEIELKKQNSENEWICDECCETKNIITSYVCISCKKENENIKLLIEQQKYFNQINQENHINSINDKKMICPNCRMDLNLKSRCSNCYNYKHNNQIDLSKEEDKICPNFKCKKPLFYKLQDKCYYCSTKIIPQDTNNELQKKIKKCLNCYYEFFVDSKNCLNCGSIIFSIDNTIKLNLSDNLKKKDEFSFNKCSICDTFHERFDKCNINFSRETRLKNEKSNEFVKCDICGYSLKNSFNSTCNQCVNKLNDKKTNFCECIYPNFTNEKCTRCFKLKNNAKLEICKKCGDKIIYPNSLLCLKCSQINSIKWKCNLCSFDNNNNNDKCQYCYSSNNYSSSKLDNSINRSRSQLPVKDKLLIESYNKLKKPEEQCKNCGQDIKFGQNICDICSNTRHQSIKKNPISNPTTLSNNYIESTNKIAIMSDQKNPKNINNSHTNQNSSSLSNTYLESNYKIPIMSDKKNTIFMKNVINLVTNQNTPTNKNITSNKFESSNNFRNNIVNYQTNYKPNPKKEEEKKIIYPSTVKQDKKNLAEVKTVNKDNLNSSIKHFNSSLNSRIETKTNINPRNSSNISKRTTN